MLSESNIIKVCKLDDFPRIASVEYKNNFWIRRILEKKISNDPFLDCVIPFPYLEI
jgi:hypothetical protein